jgi:hypothetical protein
LDSQNCRAKVGDCYADSSESPAGEGAAFLVGSAKRKAPTEKGQRESPNYLRTRRMPKSHELLNRYTIRLDKCELFSTAEWLVKRNRTVG